MHQSLNIPQIKLRNLCNRCPDRMDHESFIGTCGAALTMEWITSARARKPMRAGLSLVAREAFTTDNLPSWVTFSTLFLFFPSPFMLFPLRRTSEWSHVRRTITLDVFKSGYTFVAYPSVTCSMSRWTSVWTVIEESLRRDESSKVYIAIW